MPDVTVTLKDRPVRILQLLVEQRGITAQAIAEHLDVNGRGPVYAGGLTLLQELGLAKVVPTKGGSLWEATADGFEALGVHYYAG